MAPTSHLLVRSGVRAIRLKPRRKAGRWERPAFFNLPAWESGRSHGCGWEGLRRTAGNRWRTLGALLITRVTWPERCNGAYLLCPQFQIAEELANLLFRFEYLEKRRLKRPAWRRHRHWPFSGAISAWTRSPQCFTNYRLNARSVRERPPNAHSLETARGI